MVQCLNTFASRYTIFAHNSYILHFVLFPSIANIKVFLSADGSFQLLCFVQHGNTPAFTSVSLLWHNDEEFHDCFMSSCWIIIKFKRNKLVKVTFNGDMCYSYFSVNTIALS